MATSLAKPNTHRVGLASYAFFYNRADDGRVVFRTSKAPNKFDEEPVPLEKSKLVKDTLEWLGVNFEVFEVFLKSSAVVYGDNWHVNFQLEKNGLFFEVAFTSSDFNDLYSVMARLDGAILSFATPQLFQHLKNPKNSFAIPFQNAIFDAFKMYTLVSAQKQLGNLPDKNQFYENQYPKYDIQYVEKHEAKKYSSKAMALKKNEETAVKEMQSLFTDMQKNPEKYGVGEDLDGEELELDEFDFVLIMRALTILSSLRSGAWLKLLPDETRDSFTHWIHSIKDLRDRLAKSLPKLSEEADVPVDPDTDIF